MAMKNKTAELVIIRGLPGSGKSTRAKQEFPGHLHYEPDHLFCDTNGVYRFDLQLWSDACRWVYQMADFALARGERVVVSDVFCHEDEIEPYRRLAALETLRSVVAGVLDDRKKKTGFFDEAAAWKIIESALDGCEG